MIFFFLFIGFHTVSAHKMIIIPGDDDGALKVLYEDGSFSTRTVVTVYDEKGNEIDSGPLDEQGAFYFDHNDAHFFVATDGLGHRTEWTVGEDVVVRSDPHRWIIGGAVFMVFVLISLIFYFRTRKRNINETGSVNQ
ncbi:hypothetical protein [Alkalihalobacterium chitinilyticum]|uniref:Uncharacterized protein n=1 Tax=Alkalihalobacterium chitinilyticum TaxID=2980103 RepID=A0ABT5VED2_9BACI|nr:hypothetical protein [Alkalihalobacterium chitinilyticum]MDE5413687.1 hypothetical protein [Alkalihalobacterium chitinilyticum]